MLHLHQRRKVNIKTHREKQLQGLQTLQQEQHAVHPWFNILHQKYIVSTLIPLHLPTTYTV